MSFFDDDANRKYVPSKMHKLIHAREPMVACMQSFLKKLDTILYSEHVRSALQTVVSDLDTKTALGNADATREHVYRFHLKGGNSLFLVVRYLQTKYGVLATSSIPVIPEGDWDTSLFINPSIPDDDFIAILHTIVPYVLKELMLVTHEIASTDFSWSIQVALEYVVESLIDRNQTDFLEYKYEFVDKPSQLAIFNESEERKRELRVGNGKSAPGTLVTSNSVPFNDANFYLARILANVFANPKVKGSAPSQRMPVEIFDFSIPYKGSHLSEAWESYSEYAVYGFRVLSPIPLYFDLVKCIERNHAMTRKNKATKRIHRLHTILNEIIIPYMQTNNVINQNIRRHVRSSTRVGNVVRNLESKINVITHE